MHKITPEEGNLLGVEVSGKLTQRDYDELIPSSEATSVGHGKMRMIFVMSDFRGWDPRAAWDDFRFGLKPDPEVERIAMVGEKSWQHWMARIGSWFAQADVRYFNVSQQTGAEHWVRIQPTANAA